VNRSRLIVLLVIAVLVGAFFALEGQRYLTFDTLKTQVSMAQSFYQRYPMQTTGGFFLLYVLVTGLSFPGAVPLTLVAGAVFGLLWGTVIVSFASTLGATLAFLVSRFVLRDFVQERFGAHLRTINEGVAKEGGFYLFTLRLIPAVPFVAINVVMAMTPMRATTFYWVSQLGMLAGTLVYVNAGTQLAAIQTPREIVSFGVVGAFLLLGIFPLVAKKAIDAMPERVSSASSSRGSKCASPVFIAAIAPRRPPSDGSGTTAIAMPPSDVSRTAGRPDSTAFQTSSSTAPAWRA